MTSTSTRSSIPAHDAGTALARLEAELAFVSRRQQLERNGQVPLGWGRAADALVVWALDGDEPPLEYWPGDRAELAACRETFELAPSHLQPRMAELLVRYHDHVVSLEATRSAELAAMPAGSSAGDGVEPDRVAAGGRPNGRVQVELRRHEVRFLVELLSTDGLFAGTSGPAGHDGEASKALAEDLADYFTSLIA